MFVSRLTALPYLGSGNRVDFFVLGNDFDFLADEGAGFDFFAVFAFVLSLRRNGQLDLFFADGNDDGFGVSIVAGQIAVVIDFFATTGVSGAGGNCNSSEDSEEFFHGMFVLSGWY